MAKGSADIYGSEGSVPTVQPTGIGSPQLSAHASPEDFGAQVGTGIEKVGNAAEKLSNEYGTIVNETLMTKADTDFAMRLGKIKADYTSKTGMDAYNSFPKYQQDISDAFQATRAGLPLGAQHGFDMLGARTMANHIADGSSFATAQLKEARRDSYSSLTNESLRQLTDPNVAADPQRSQDHLDTIHFATQAQMDTSHPGLKTDPNTGEVSFNEDTPEGKNLKANFQQRLDTNLSQAYLNKYDTLAKQDVFAAHDAYEKDRNNMPKAAQVALDASFGPRLQAAHTQIATGNTIAQAQNDHFDMLTNPAKQQSEKIGNAIFSQESGGKFGNQVSSSGAIGGAQIMPATFAQYAKPGETINNPNDNKAVGQRIIDDYTKRYNGDASRVAVAYFSGPGNVAPAGSATPWIKDTVDTDGKSVSSYVSDVSNRVGTGAPKTYATNENGAPLSQADYFRLHSQDVLAKGDAYAEQQMPGDLALKRSVRETLNNYMTKTIANENAAHIMDNRNVMKAINGDLTKGKLPMTEDELRAIPGVGPLIDKIATQDTRFYEQIPTLIAKSARRNDVTNSPNSFDTITRTLDSADNPNRISSQDHLDRLLARSDGTGINMKDYKDAKQAIDLGADDTAGTMKKTILDHMKDIATANGNIDGQGQQRAVQWYNNVMAAYKKNEAMGDKKDTDFINHLAPDGSLAPNPPSRMQQIENWAKSLFGGKQPTTVNVMSPDGTPGTIPAENLEKALAAGYKKVE